MGTPSCCSAQLRLTARTGKVCWEFKLRKVDGKPNQAHIHKGGKGVAGNVVVPLGANYKRQGCTTASAGTPQWPLTGKSRTTFGDIDGGPNGAGNPFSTRVSARRQGDNATNGTGEAETFATSADFCATTPAGWLAAAGCQ